MNKKLMVLASAVLSAALTLQAGTAGAASQPSSERSASSSSAANASNHAEAVYLASLPLLKSSSKLPAAISYLNNNIYAVTPYRATLMILKLENIQKAALSSWEDKFSGSSIQRKLKEIYTPGAGMDKLADSAGYPAIRTLLKSAGDSGYKLESAEGNIFPVIDYIKYRKYKMYVTPDIRDYISIMATESDLPSAKDDGLIIAWSDVASRTLSLECFITAYPRSNRITAAKTLYARYLSSTFYGLNNTPLFHYDNLEMDLEAQKAYTALLAKHADATPFLEKLKGFMELLKDNGYKLDDAAKLYLSKEIPQK
ncbi:hypothetical protein [Paenibacillus sp. sgz500958]|uniref:hypothetical protein n=1 Tax=Paenibacillus sp. sgz500958 TaxID=3242475 RepID=UPI0036D36EE2